MSAYDPLQKHRRLWNSPSNILHESLIGSVIKYPNLIYLDNCKAIVRQDFNILNKKVKIIGGGIVIDGLNYAGFVGPGMLTAAVHGLQGNASSVPTTSSILELINHIKTKQREINGILLLVHDCVEYYFNFFLAKEKAEEMGIPVKMVLVRDQINRKLDQRALSPRSPSGILFIYKIAGAMSEEGNTLDEIYNTCNEIIENGIVFSIGVYIVENLSNESNQVEITRGDILSDRDIKRFSIINFSAKTLVENLVNCMINADNSQKFIHDSKVALILDYFGGFSELEASIIIKELVQQLNEFQLKIENIYTGVFHTTIEMHGFHLSVLNLSKNSQLLHYLDAPTMAFSWPKIIGKPITLQTDTGCENYIQVKNVNNESYINTNNNKISLEKKKIFLTEKIVETELFLTALLYACDALIACAAKIDMLDKPSTSKEYDKCGTRLANIAKTVRAAIFKKKFIGLCLSSTIFKVALIFEKYIQDPQAELYMFFLNSIGNAIKNQKYLQTVNWINVFLEAIDSVNKIVKGTKFSDTLLTAKTAFLNTYTNGNNISVIYALEQAVIAAQKQTSHIILHSRKISENVLNDKNCGFTEYAGAHAIGVWMRGAFEGIKIKYLNQLPQNKYKHSNDSDSNDVMII